MNGATATHPTSTTSQPTTASSIQWLPVPTITTAVMTAYAQPEARRIRLLVTSWMAIATHSAQPAWSDGNAASSLVR